ARSARQPPGSPGPEPAVTHRAERAGAGGGTIGTMSHGDQEPGGQEAAAGPPASAGSPDPSTRSDDVSGAVATDEMTATPGSGDAPARDVPSPETPVADVPVDGGAAHTAATPNEPGTDAEPRDPWERFGWIMSSIWLLFLGFPIASAVVADVPVAARVAT